MSNRRPSLTSSPSESQIVEHCRYDMVCRPIKSLRDVEVFLKEPPTWRSLCIELKPHSEFAIRNMDIVRQNHPYEDVFIEPERPQTFCHSNPDHEDVNRHRREDLPKTLVCHDMANGYHDDSKIDGTGYADAYTFYNWAVVDIFCYFSHHFITVPPLGWINIGHLHGVKVIGTVITEWAEGTAIWAEILASPDQCSSFAHALVRIAKTLKFDGWLLNVEHKVGKPDMLLEFVRYLHALLHRELASPVLLWYDSVTVEGNLNWQNGLNARNRAFFDACDGIFTNYAWGEADVRASRAEAGGRARDVFVGVDVWGRNFLGGGHFNTQEAVKIVYEHGCSLAIFAPAWTHEAMADEEMRVEATGAAERIRPGRKFQLRERALWGSLWPFLHTKLPHQLPFRTSFCRGQGRRRWLYGEVLGPNPWFNLRHQQYQPSAAHGAHGYALAAGALAGAAASGQEVGGVSRAEPLTLKDSFQNVTTLSSPAETETSESELTEHDPSEESLDRKKTVWERVRHIFRKKARQKEEEPTVSVVESSRSGMISSGKSMQQISLNFRLGINRDKTRYTVVYIPEELECLETFYNDSFNGGSCLAINPCDETNTEHRYVRLFHCDFNIDGTLIACVVTKIMPEDSGQYLNIVLSVRNRYGATRKVTLVGRDLPGTRSSSEDTRAPLRPADPDFRELQAHLLLHEPGFYVATENAYGWKVRYYVVPLRGLVMSINARTGLEAGPVLLGHFGLCQIEKTTFPKYPKKRKE